MTPATPLAIRLGALSFGAATVTVSWWHWWTFQYTSFDLAFYVQALWLALRGQWQVSLLNVPLMGNHAEPIVFLLAPFFALWSHPMLFVVAQTLALASMPFTAWRITQQLGIARCPATLLALATIFTPATFLVGIYEFHPEALAAPLLLLLIEAKLANRQRWFWVWFIAVLSVKENMALLLAAWCVTFAVVDAKRGSQWVRWNVWPGLAAIAWLLICAQIISPRLNAGTVDYLELYSHLGSSAGEIASGFILAPQRALGAIWRALTHGNLVWGMLLPLLALPVLRPRWWVIAAPLLLQHLLSWRPSEWSLGAHYPAPFIPLLWIAAAEVFPRLPRQRAVAIAIFMACVGSQFWFGPVRALSRESAVIKAHIESRSLKAELLAAIPGDASVMASQPFLSHLAKRERLISLHHTLKGLKTLSRAPYETPAPTDAVLIDYEDPTTFNVAAGYYHPRMRTADGREVPSSDRLLHEFLRQQQWHPVARNAVILLRRGEPLPHFEGTMSPIRFDETSTLHAMQIAENPAGLHLRLSWEFSGERERFPWLMLVLNDGKQLRTFTKGACAPEATSGRHTEQCTVEIPRSTPAGEYSIHALFYDASAAMWRGELPPGNATHVLHSLDLGRRQLTPVAKD